MEPHTVIKSSYIGYKAEWFLPFVGLDMMQLSTSDEYYYEDWERDGAGNFYKYWQGKGETNLSAMLCIPHIGGKFYLGQLGAIPYLSASVFKVLPLKIDARLHLQEYEYDSAGTIVWRKDTTYDFKEREDYAKDILGVIGISVGFGAEYKFAPHFSVSGEYGINYYSTSGHYEEKIEYKDYKYAVENKFSGLFGLTYGRVQLNFYLGAKE